MDSKKGVKTPLWEDILIICTILTLWPTVLRRENLLSKTIMFVTLLILGFILLRRVKRFNSFFKK